MSDVSVKHIRDEWLQEYLDGELDGARLDHLHEHLHYCTACQRRLEAWQSLYAEIEHVAELDPTHDMTPVILSRLDTPDLRRGWSPLLLVGQAILAITLFVYGWMQFPTILDLDRFRTWVSIPWGTVQEMIDQLIPMIMGTARELTTWTPSSGELIASIPQIPVERTLLMYLGAFLVILWFAINRILLNVNGQTRDIQSGG